MAGEARRGRYDEMSTEIAGGGGGGVPFRPDHFRALLRAGGPQRAELRRRADAVREQAKGSVVRLRALIEFSNRCVRNCLYCGLRRDNRSLERYALDPEEVVRLAVRAARAGYATVVLQSGEDPAYDRETLARMVGAIKDRAPGVAVTLSVGEHSRADYRAWRAAGADRYLLKHETSDPTLYARLRPGRRLEQRLRCAEWLKELGYELGLGNIVGLPDQTEESLLGDLELLARLEPEMVGVGPFIPHPATPLAAEPPGDVDLTLNIVALTRLVLPLAHIPATTALATLDRRARGEALRSGADVLMVSIGPAERRRLYEIYPDRDDGALGAEFPAPRGGQATNSDEGPEGPRVARTPCVAEDPLAEQRRRITAWLAGLGRTTDGLDGRPEAQAAATPNGTAFVGEARLGIEERSVLK